MASDDDFLAIRRFDRLHVRVLLADQAHISRLEEQLDALDQRLSTRQAPDQDNGSMRNDAPERRELVNTISDALEKYGTTIK